MANTDTTNALTTIIKALTPLKPDERHRTVDAAMLFLGEATKTSSRERKVGPSGADRDTGDGEYPAAVTKWMQQHSISSEELDQVFHFKDDSFDIHGAPGRSKREQTLNTYVLTGLGAFLTTGDRKFADATARGFCETTGCFDAPNHAKYLKDKGAEFSGDKSKGYSLSNVGVRRGATLVKELAGNTK